MYIKINNKQYPCTGYNPTPTSVYLTAENITLPVSSTISLHADDGFTLVEDINPEDYARQTYNGGVLTLTNEPEPEPYVPPEPQEPEPTQEEYLVDLDYRLSLIELGVN